MPTYLLILCTYPVMALQFAVTKLGFAGGLSAIDVGGLRYLGAALFGAPLFFRSDVRAMIARHPFVFLLLGLLGGGLYGQMFALALAFVPAAHGAMIVPSLTIATATIGSGLVFGDWPNPLRWLGLALIIGGLLLFGFGASLSSLAFSPLGDALFCCLGIAWGSAPVIIRRWQVPAAAVAAAFSVTGLPVVAFWLWSEGTVAALAAPAVSLLQIVFQGGLLTVLAFMFWGELVGRIGPAKTVIGLAAVPMIALAMGIPLLGEWPHPLQWLGALVVITGITLASGALQRRSER